MMMMIDWIVIISIVLVAMLVAVLPLVFHHRNHDHPTGEVTGKPSETELLRLEVVVSRLLIIDLGREKVEMIMQRYADALKTELMNQHRIDRGTQEEATGPQE